jgi:hypothetical protein
MAIDVATTIKLIKDIISRSIEPEAFDKKYVGMDL